MGQARFEMGKVTMINQRKDQRKRKILQKMALPSRLFKFYSSSDRFLSDKIKQNGKKMYQFSQLATATTIPVKSSILITTSSAMS